MSAHGTAALNLFQLGATMNGGKYLDLLKNLFRDPHDCNAFKHDSASCHGSKLVKTFQQKNVDILDLPGNSPGLNPIENLWHVMKIEVAD